MPYGVAISRKGLLTTEKDLLNKMPPKQLVANELVEELIKECFPNGVDKSEYKLTPYSEECLSFGSYCNIICISSYRFTITNE